MNQKRHANAKTRYFRKDYKPAVAMAQKKKNSKSSSKVSKTIRKMATTTGKAAQKTVKSVQKVASKVAQPKVKTATKVERVISAKKSPTRSTRKQKHNSFTWREITLISQLSVSAFVILFTFVFCNINDPIKRSQNELEKIADAYYIEYLYPTVLGKYLNKPETILKDYTTGGLPTVRLRQLLLHNNGQFADSSEVFSNAFYKCNADNTLIRYYPVEPYGPRDYTVTYITACEKVGKLN